MQAFGGTSVSDVFVDAQVRELADAACKGNRKNIQALLKKDIDVNAKGVDGITPLFWALKCENISGMLALLEKGANPNQHLDDGYGYTPVMNAAELENSDFLKLLLEFDGNPDSESLEGFDSAMSNAMQYGAYNKNWDNYYLLLEAGADLDKDYFGGTIAERMLGTYGRYRKTLELLDRGYDKNLHILLYRGNNRAVSEESGERPYRKELIARLKKKVSDEEYQAFLDSRK